MIERLDVHNFKRFARLSVRMRSLTVLTGLNGSGKSTLLQSLLLIRVGRYSVSLFLTGVH
jgi:predicted ATP-dependent endonuclease of OLD family